MEPELRVISGQDWAAFRALRLRALTDSPRSFGSTRAEAETHPESVWRERAGGPSPVVMAFQEADPVAMGGLFAPEHSREAYIWGMWVAPGWRGQGLGARILEELLAWGRRLNRIVALHVTEGNDGARRLYEAHGFASTGEWQPLREGSDLRMETLRQQRA